jgi:imidazolonepropionase-like amidohydrolase
VKVIADFPGPDGNWFAAPPTYPRDVLARLVREVHAAGARVLGHSTGHGAVDLVAAGIDSVEHGMTITSELAAEMADKGIAWTTTLATAYKHVGPLAAQDGPVGAYIRAQLDRLREVLPAALGRGVTLMAGTDEIAMGALARELEYLVEFGLTPTEALAAGSTAARTWLGFPDAGGDGAVDLVLYESDPRRDLSVLRQPSAIVFDGVLV